MARRRVAAPVVVDGVPAALLDPDHPVWSSLPEAEALAQAHGLAVRWPDPSPLRDAAFERFKVFRWAWAQAAGVLNQWGRPDLSVLRGMGVYASYRGPRVLGER